MKKKGLGSPADKLGVHIRKYRNQKNGHKRIWRIKSERTRNESQKLKMEM